MLFVMQEKRKYVVDTNLYIDALRTDEGQYALETFRAGFAPFEHLSAVVVLELQSGVRGRDSALVNEAFIAPLEECGRLVTPTYHAWREAGRVLSELVAPNERRALPRSFVNDVLLAMSCRESGLTLVTKNLRDFARIAAVRPFEFVPAWPVPKA